VQGRDPCDMAVDKDIIRCIWRASLDAFWSRESGTVAKNAGQLEFLDWKAHEAGINCDRMFPVMGPLPLQDKAGMGVAICVLMRTLDQGKMKTLFNLERQVQPRWHLPTCGKHPVKEQDWKRSWLKTKPRCFKHHAPLQETGLNASC